MIVCRDNACVVSIHPAFELLLGGQPESVPELARLASPVFHIDQNDPPLLLLHGACADARQPLLPHAKPRLREALRRAKRQARKEFDVLPLRALRLCVRLSTLWTDSNYILPHLRLYQR
jgi:hypothetical protein